MCIQNLHMSQFTALWLVATGLEHIPQGYFIFLRLMKIKKRLRGKV